MLFNYLECKKSVCVGRAIFCKEIWDEDELGIGIYYLHFNINAQQ